MPRIDQTKAVFDAAEALVAAVRAAYPHAGNEMVEFTATVAVKMAIEETTPRAFPPPRGEPISQQE